jgi:23S rRNA (guanosine2251-2'-O)-methyltransferase
VFVDRDRGASEPPATGESERFGAEPADDLIWGRHPAQAALEGDRPIHRIWCTPELRFAPRFLQLLREAKSGGVLVEEVTWARLGQLTGGAVHQGIVLQAAAAETLDLGTLIDGCRGIGEPPLLMAVDGLTDPHNLGAIVRSAEALGAHGLVLPQRRNAGLTGSVAKVAAGALEHLPVARVVNLNRSLEQLKEEGYRVVGLAEEGTVSLTEADLDGPLVVVTGSESQGLSMLTRKHCDQLIRIPLRGATPSLNASVATALLLYEVARRGWMQAITGNAPAPRIVRPQLPSKAAASNATSAAEAEAVATTAAAEAAAAALEQPTAVADGLDTLGDQDDLDDLDAEVSADGELLAVEEQQPLGGLLAVEELLVVEEELLSVEKELLVVEDELLVAAELVMEDAPAVGDSFAGAEPEPVEQAEAADPAAQTEPATDVIHNEPAANAVPSEASASEEPETSTEAAAASAAASVPAAAAPPEPLELTLGLSPASPTGFQGDIQL